MGVTAAPSLTKQTLIQKKWLFAIVRTVKNYQARLSEHRFFAEDENFDLKSGELKTYIKIAESGNERIQAFCPNCGSSIYSTSVGEAPKMLGLRVGAINQRSELKPSKQLWCRSAQAWLGQIGDIHTVEKQ